MVHCLFRVTRVFFQCIALPVHVVLRYKLRDQMLETTLSLCAISAYLNKLKNA